MCTLNNPSCYAIWHSEKNLKDARNQQALNLLGKKFLSLKNESEEMKLQQLSAKIREQKLLLKNDIHNTTATMINSGRLDANIYFFNGNYHSGKYVFMYHENKFQLNDWTKKTIISFTINEVISIIYHDGIDFDGEVKRRSKRTKEICYIKFRWNSNSTDTSEVTVRPCNDSQFRNFKHYLGIVMQNKLSV